MFAAKFRVGNPYLTGLWKGCPLFWTNPLWGAYLWPTRYWMLSIGSRRHGSRPHQALRFLAHRSVINASPRLRILKSFGCVLLDMSGQPDISPTGAFDARYVAFIETIAQLRPRLHRYCSRMTGSVMDGEDVVQDARVGGDCGDEEQLVQSEGPRVYKGIHSDGRNGNPGSMWRLKGERRWQRRY